MTSGSFKVVEVAVAMILNIALPALLVHRDEKRLSEIELSRAWNKASFWSAMLAFGPLCLPFHGVRTRRSFLGLMVGLDFFWVVLLGQTLAGALLGSLRPE
jgi:hypothetical protein